MIIQAKYVHDWHTQDGEDRIVCDHGGTWWWQTRGCKELFGPFDTPEEAADATEASCTNSEIDAHTAEMLDNGNLTIS